MFSFLVCNTFIYFALVTFWTNGQWASNNQILNEGSFKYSYDNTNTKMISTSLVTVWFGNRHWNGPEWTLCIELWGSYLVFITVISFYNYSRRFTIYLSMMAVTWFGHEYWNFKNKTTINHLYYLSLFIVGLVICDIENAKDWG